MTRLLPLALLALWTATPAAAQTVRTTDLSPATADSILAIARVADERWNAGDANGLSTAYTPDGHMRMTGMPVDLRGRPTIAAYFATSFAARQGQMRHRTVVEELQQIAPGVVAADGQVWVDVLGADGTYRPVRRFTMNAVAVRTPGGWRLRVNRVHPEASVEPAAR